MACVAYVVCEAYEAYVACEVSAYDDDDGVPFVEEQQLLVAVVVVAAVVVGMEVVEAVEEVAVVAAAALELANYFLAVLEVQGSQGVLGNQVNLESQVNP